MPFLASASLTASYCLVASGTGLVFFRKVIQPVPVYSQYRSILPLVRALRTTGEPTRPVWSFTWAPASLSSSTVILPRMSCSVNSLEPTVRVAPLREPPPPPPLLLLLPPQAAASSASTAASTTQLSHCERVCLIGSLPLVACP